MMRTTLGPRGRNVLGTAGRDGGQVARAHAAMGYVPIAPGKPAHCYQWSPAAVELARSLKRARIITGGPCLDGEALGAITIRGRGGATRTARAMHGALGATPVIDAICQNKANTMLANHDQRVMQLIAEYVPPERVEWTDVASTLYSLVDMGKIASDLYAQVAHTYLTDGMRNALDAMYDTIDAPALLADKAPMDGATYKNWVVQSMFAIGNLMKAIIVAQCEKPWYVSFFEWYQPKFDAVWNVVADVGKGLTKVPDVLSTMWTVMKWSGIAIGAYWLYTTFGKKKQA